MKVKELIEELKKHDPEKDVRARKLSNGSFGGDVTVREGKHVYTDGRILIEG
jgi:hypothetical protein